MKRDEILNMPAGRDLDALIAEKVMGWTRETYWVATLTIATGQREDEERSGLMGPDGIRDVDNYPCYSDDIAAAWEVVEKLRYEYSITVETTRTRRQEILAGFFVPNSYKPTARAVADTAPLAICRAALLAAMEEK